jgi:arylsulfatase A-like enzyme
MSTWWVRGLAVAWTLAGCGWGASPPAAPLEDGEAATRVGRKARKAAPEPEAFVPDPNRPVPQGKPNVLLIVWDTVRADRLTPYGHARDTTPHLAKLAAEGVLYERAVSPGMWTVPGHASLFTGLPESAHGTTASHQWLEGRFPTLAETLSDAGWSTYLFAANPHVGPHTNLGQGFEKQEAPSDPAWKRKATRATMGKLIPTDASNTMGPAWKPSTYAAGRDGDRTKDAGSVAVEALRAFLDGRQGEDAKRPFFATINYMEAHVPRLPTMASRQALFSEAEIAKQLTFDQSYGYLLAYTVGLHEFSEPQKRLIEDVYDASLRDLDAVTQQLFDALDARGVWDDTIVIVTADHGEHLGDHHLADHKFSVFNGLVRVPLIVRYPKAMSPARVSEVVSTMDVFATVAELTGAPMPAGTLSRSLVGAREGVAFAELVEPTTLVFDRMRKVHPDFDSRPYEHCYASVETATHKCIRRCDGATQVFDPASDPGELRDLAASDPALAARVCGQIDAWKGTFTAYDAKAAGAEAAPERAMSKPERCKLVALGYLTDDPADPCQKED